MPDPTQKLVEVPDVGVVAFPYDMPDAEIAGHIHAHRAKAPKTSSDLKQESKSFLDSTSAVPPVLTTEESEHQRQLHPARPFYTPQQLSTVNKLTEIQPIDRRDSLPKKAATFVGDIGAGGMGVVLHPIQNVGGMVSSVLPWTKTPNPIQSMYQGLNTQPGETIASGIGQAAVFDAAFHIPEVGASAYDAIKSPLAQHIWADIKRLPHDESGFIELPSRAGTKHINSQDILDTVAAHTETINALRSRLPHSNPAQIKALRDAIEQTGRQAAESGDKVGATKAAHADLALSHLLDDAIEKTQHLKTPPPVTAPVDPGWVKKMAASLLSSVPEKGQEPVAPPAAPQTVPARPLSLAEIQRVKQQAEALNPVKNGKSVIPKVGPISLGPESAIVPRGTTAPVPQKSLESGQINVQANFPPLREDAPKWQNASQNANLAKQFSRLGIPGFSIDAPYKFGLSEQGNIDPATGQIQISAAASDPEHTLAHELAHDIYQRLSPENKAAIDRYVQGSTAYSGHAGGLEERVSDHFADVLLGRDYPPISISKVFFESPLQNRPAPKRLPKTPEPQEPQRPAFTRTWSEVAKYGGGNLRKGDDIEAIVKADGDFPLAVKDITGARHVVPASVVAQIMKDPIVDGYVDSIFMAKNHLAEDSDQKLQQDIKQYQGMVAARRFMGRGKEPDGPPMSEQQVAEWQAKLATLQAEAKKRATAGYKYKPVPSHDIEQLRINSGGSRPLVRALETANNARRLAAPKLPELKAMAEKLRPQPAVYSGGHPETIKAAMANMFPPSGKSPGPATDFMAGRTSPTVATPPYRAGAGDPESVKAAMASMFPPSGKSPGPATDFLANEAKEQKPTKYKYGNTQADVPADSEAGKALAQARAQIDPNDLMPSSNTSGGGGLEDQAHITVRYGIDGDDHDGIKKYLESQAPFEATLGETTAFPPSKHSDGAAPVVVSIESPDLRKMEKEIDAHGKFIDRTFPDYRPHVTLGYVKPEAAEKYVGMKDLQGKKFTINSVSISKKDGSTETVQLKGTPQGVTPVSPETHFSRNSPERIAAKAAVRKALDEYSVFKPETVKAYEKAYADWLMTTRRGFDYLMGQQMGNVEDSGDLKDIDELERMLGITPVEPETSLKYKAADQGQPFYLKSERILAEKMRGPMPAADIQKMLLANGVKAEEMKWTGLDDFLWENWDKKVTPEQIKEFVDTHDLQIQEVAKGKGPQEIANDKKFRELADKQNKIARSLHEKVNWMKSADRKAAGFRPGADPMHDLSQTIEHTDFTGDRAPLDALLVEWPEKYRAEATEFANNALEVRKHESAFRADITGEPKFGTYVMPGGDNYRELLVTLPALGRDATYEKLVNEYKVAEKASYDYMEKHRPSLANPDSEIQSMYQRVNTAKDALDQYKAKKDKESSGGVFRPHDNDYLSPHWDEPNIVGHIRFNDRVGPNGEKILHIEEAQSDSHQKARKVGYVSQRVDEKTPLVAKQTEPGWYTVETADGRFVTNVTGSEETKSPEAAIAEARRRMREEPGRVYKGEGVPDMPWKKTWHEMLLKRAIRYAADNGYDGISWTPGEEQAARYDLSKQVDKIVVIPTEEGSRAVRIHTKTAGESIKLMVDKNGTVTPAFSSADEFAGKNIADVVGKDVAGKIMSASRETHLQGGDLKVGGEGMKGFYDKIIPDAANKIGKKFGAKVGKTEFITETKPKKTYVGPSYTAEQLKQIADESKGTMIEGSASWVADSVKQGSSLEDAMDAYGSPMLAEKLGGSIDVISKKESKTVPYLPITPEMRASGPESLFNLVYKSPAAKPSEISKARQELAKVEAELDKNPPPLEPIDETTPEALKEWKKRHKGWLKQAEPLLDKYNDLSTKLKSLENQNIGQIRQLPDGHKVLWLKRAGLRSLHIGFGGTLDVDKYVLGGVSIAPEQVINIVHNLSIRQPEFAKEVASLLEKAQNYDGVVTVSAIPKKGESIREALDKLREELNHGWQKIVVDAVGDHLSAEKFAEINDAIPGPMNDHLVTNYDLADDGSEFSNKKRVLEASSKMLSTAPEEFGMSEYEWAGFLFEYFSAIEAEHGPNALDTLLHVTTKARQVKEDYFNATRGTKDDSEDAGSVGSIQAGGAESPSGVGQEAQRGEPQGAGSAAATETGWLNDREDVAERDSASGAGLHQPPQEDPSGDAARAGESAGGPNSSRMAPEELGRILGDNEKTVERRQGLLSGDEGKERKGGSAETAPGRTEAVNRPRGKATLANLKVEAAARDPRRKVYPHAPDMGTTEGGYKVYWW